MSRLVLVAGLLFMATPATAMPRFSARKGLPCSACHVDPTGGGMRNDFGRDVFALTELPASDGASDTPREPPPAALGADVRLLYMHLRKRHADQPRINSFYLMESSLYVAASPSEEVTLYLAPTIHGSESVFFEAAALFRPGWHGAYVKAGRFVPAYGYKLANHTAFVRKQLGFGATAKSTGVELGVQPGPFSAQVSVFNGTGEGDWDENPGKGVSTRLAYQLRTRPVKLEAGLSGYYNVDGQPAEDDPTGQDTRRGDIRAGVFGSLGSGRFTWLGEADLSVVDDRREPAAVRRLASYQALAFAAMRGLDIVATYELWDDDLDASGNAVHRVGGGIDRYPWPGLELTLRYRATIGDERHALADIHEMLAVAHVFF